MRPRNLPASIEMMPKNLGWVGSPDTLHQRSCFIECRALSLKKVAGGLASHELLRDDVLPEILSSPGRTGPKVFERIGRTVLAAAVSVLAASCASERDRYGFGYDCTNADARKAALDTSNMKIVTYGNGNPATGHESGKLDHGTKLGVVKTRGTVDVPSFYNKALNGGVDEAKDEYFHHLILTKECSFPVDGMQKTWFHMDRPEDEPQFDVLPRGVSLLGWIASPWVSEDVPQFKGECSPR